MRALHWWDCTAAGWVAAQRPPRFAQTKPRKCMPPSDHQQYSDARFENREVHLGQDMRCRFESGSQILLGSQRATKLADGSGGFICQLEGEKKSANLTQLIDCSRIRRKLPLLFFCGSAKPLPHRQAQQPRIRKTLMSAKVNKALGWQSATTKAKTSDKADTQSATTKSGAGMTTTQTRSQNAGGHPHEHPRIRFGL